MRPFYTPVRCIFKLLCSPTNERLPVLGIIIDLGCIKLFSFVCIGWYQFILQIDYNWPIYPPDLFNTLMILGQLMYLLWFYSCLILLVALVLIPSFLLFHPLWLHPYSRNMWTILRMKLVPIRSFVRHHLDNLCDFCESQFFVSWNLYPHLLPKSTPFVGDSSSSSSPAAQSYSQLHISLSVPFPLFAHFGLQYPNPMEIQVRWSTFSNTSCFLSLYLLLCVCLHIVLDAWYCLSWPWLQRFIKVYGGGGLCRIVEL